MGKVKEVKSKSGKASAKPLAVKNAGVTKASQTAGAKSKKIAKEAAIKASKKDDKKKKKVEISSDSESDSDSGSGSESSASSDSDSSESEAEKKPTKAVANGKAKATAKVAESSESDSESESGSDSDSESKSESDSDAKPAAAKATSNGDVAMADGSDADSSDSESEDDSDSDSDSEEQTKAKPAKAAAGKKAVNGSAKAEESSADSESDADSDDSSEEDSDDSESDSDDSESEEAEEDTKAPSKKRKADENEEAPAKKSKTDAAQSDKPATLFVGNLSWNVDDAMLQEEFKFCGEVVSARVITDRESGRSKGFGYVDFASPADAEKAHAEKQGAFIDGRQIKVDFSTGKSNNGTDSAADRAKKFGDVPSPESDTLFVGNLPFDADEDVVGAFFGEVAEVKSLRLPTDQESGRRKGFGYVTFNSVEDAKAAFTKLAGQSINGRPCRLDYSTPKPAREGGGFGGGGRGRGGFGGRGGGGRGGGGRGGGGRGGFGGRGGARGGGGFQGKKITF